MMLDETKTNRLQRAVIASLHDHWGLYVGEGLLLGALGVVALLAPPVATLTIELLVGSILLVCGGAGLVTTYQLRGTQGLWWSLLSAVMSIAAGAALLVSPAQGALSLTVILIAYFLIEGIASIVFSFDQREDLPSWGWLLANGVVDLVLGGMIFLGLPSSAAWAIGLLVGINMLFGGATLIAMALQSRALVPAPATSTRVSP